jgi:DNA-binding transcriptional MerR regulator
MAAGEPRATVLERVFPTDRVLELTGLSKRQLQYWDETGFLSPSIASKSGRGHRRLYDFRDLVGLRVAADLRVDGIPLQTIRRVTDHLRQLDYRHPLAEVTFWSMNGDVVFREADTVRTSQRPDQTVAEFLVPVAKIVDVLTEKVVELDSRRPVGQTEQRRGRLGSKLLIAGTRIPVATIKNLVRDGADEDEVLSLYPGITRDDVRAALQAEEPQKSQRRAS